MATTVQWNNGGFLDEVQRRSGTPAGACFQCHKCSTGCPVGAEMDFLPSQVMRLVHLGAEAEVLGARAIWLCASCEACTTRCPMGIDIAGVMDTLRIMAIERQVALRDAHGRQFNRSFLGSVRRHGRVYEMGMMAAYKLRTFDLFSDVTKVPQMLAKGKLALRPKRSASAKEVREAFRRAEEEGRERGEGRAEREEGRSPSFSPEPTASFSPEPTASFSPEPTASFSPEPTATGRDRDGSAENML